ncbi:MAG: hypothetical protein IJV67_00960 [Clostridia bacterium]|nr:hypothetical protein [Clostridia bacterium]
MKKFISFLLALMLCVSFSSCDNKEKKNNNLGEYYTLQEAYNREILTDNDLIEIAGYYQGDDLINKKDPLSINSLTEETKNQIVKCYLLNIIKDINVSAEYVNIYAYYGTYNGAVAIGITDTYNVYDLVVMAEYRVGDVTLYNYAESDIRIWVKLQD